MKVHLGGLIPETSFRCEMKCSNVQSPQILKETKEERDLGVLISNNFKSSPHIAAAAVNMANQILGPI